MHYCVTFLVFLNDLYKAIGGYNPGILEYSAINMQMMPKSLSYCYQDRLFMDQCQATVMGCMRANKWILRAYPHLPFIHTFQEQSAL